MNLLFLCAAALSLGACSSDDSSLSCGEGTIEQNGQCVARTPDAGEQDAAAPDADELDADGPQDADHRDADATDAAGDAMVPDDVGIDVSPDVGPVECEGDTGVEPVVTELEISSSFLGIREDGRIVVPQGLPYRVEAEPTFLQGTECANAADTIDVQFEFRGAATHQSVDLTNRSFVLFGETAGDLDVRATVSQPQLGTTVTSEWQKLRIGAKEDFNWDLMVRVIQDLSLFEDVAYDHYGSHAFHRTLPVGGRARVYGIVLFQKPGETGWYHEYVLPSRWFSLSAGSPGSIDADKLTANAAGTVELTATYNPPVDGPSLSDSTQIDFVADAPLDVLGIGGAGLSADAKINYRVSNRATLSRLSSSAVTLDPLPPADGTDINYSTTLYDPGESLDSRLVPIGHYATGNLNQVHQLSETWRGETFAHEYWKGFVKALPAADVSIDESGDLSAFSIDPTNLAVATGQPGVKSFELSVDGLSAVLVAGTALDEAAGASISTSPQLITFTDWNQCQNLSVTLTDAGGSTFPLDSPRDLTTYCSITADGGFDPNFPIESCTWNRAAGQLEVCTRYGNLQGDENRTQGSGTLRLRAMGLTADVELITDLPDPS